jgi:4-hydroxy-tetrahydrodipicolinate reductase
MEQIRVVVNGALGKMGREVIKALVHEPGLKIVGAAEEKVTQQYLPLVDAPGLVPFSSDLTSLLKSCNPDVLVDFTNAEVSIAAARMAAKEKVNLVIGTTGLSEENLAEIEQLCQTNRVGAVVAPNFSLGAALLIKLAELAAKFFDHAEIVEMHHDKKLDAPSGTAIATAKAMSQAHGKPLIYPKAEREIISNTRGGQIDGIAIHSLRLPGFMAGQEVIFGGKGETLSLRHEAISRECYMPGVILAIKEVTKHKGLIYGLNALLKE